MIHIGNCLDILPTLPAHRFQACITSPPYFRLRDYGTVGQHGLEPHHDCLAWAKGEAPCADCFVCTQRRVFAEIWRVLRPDGTLWMNLGDSTASSGGAGQGGNTGRVGRRYPQTTQPKTGLGLNPKNLLGIPWRVALALQADGWILRQDIIWWKKSPMPETVSDRPTRAHEYLFLLVKQRHYYYDAAAIAEPVSPGTHARMAQNVDAQAGSTRANGGADPRPFKAGGRSNLPHIGAGTQEARRQSRKAYKTPSGWDTSAGGHRELAGRYDNNGVGWGYADGETAKPRTVGRAPRVKNNPGFDAAMADQATTRNKRSVWHLAADPFKGAHFATFPRDLVRPCVLAGTRPGDSVIDPYFGAGTTGVVCAELGRACEGIEVNADYANDIAAPRLHHQQTGLGL